MWQIKEEIKDLRKYRVHAGGKKKEAKNKKGRARNKKDVSDGVQEDAVYDNDLKNRSFDTVKDGTDNDTEAVEVS
ncbi:uncharacterized protein LOC105444228 isoform X3 [Strongylocentrotus purpuratus]|uniref:Uncharacterized protein n=1 Tax=Strongylocentrotus purpuratus TaxID=7668 RepID=A0A7M7PAJ4_STRPU|nr:uncharacterized protein LOC105442333 isoform X3 [Strongylocentrotus purpuratus]XP_030849228.1 uncharacterized protein LOC105444228 isoform X3 [Strongylocentrotus purpuratus]